MHTEIAINFSVLRTIDWIADSARGSLEKALHTMQMHLFTERRGAATARFTRVSSVSVAPPQIVGAVLVAQGARARRESARIWKKVRGALGLFVFLLGLLPHPACPGRFCGRSAFSWVLRVPHPWFFRVGSSLRCTVRVAAKAPLSSRGRRGAGVPCARRLYACRGGGDRGIAFSWVLRVPHPWFFRVGSPLRCVVSVAARPITGRAPGAARRRA
jgi:hypothetical protein